MKMKRQSSSAPGPESGVVRFVSLWQCVCRYQSLPLPREFDLGVQETRARGSAGAVNPFCRDIAQNEGATSAAAQHTNPLKAAKSMVPGEVPSSEPPRPRKRGRPPKARSEAANSRAQQEEEEQKLPSMKAAGEAGSVTASPQCCRKLIYASLSLSKVLASCPRRVDASLP